MKTLVIAITIILLTASFAIISSVYISKSCDELIHIVKNLPDGTDSLEKSDVFSTISKSFSEKWKENETFLEFYVPLDILEKIDEMQNEVCSRFFSGDLAGYNSAKEKLLLSLEGLKKTK